MARQGNGAVTLSDRYLRMALDLRKLDEQRGKIKKSMKLIEQDALDGKIDGAQTELPIGGVDDTTTAKA